MLEMNTQ